VPLEEISKPVLTEPLSGNEELSKMVQTEKVPAGREREVKYRPSLSVIVVFQVSLFTSTLTGASFTG